MKKINETNAYTMYKNKLDTNEEYIIAVSNSITSSVEINVLLDENFAIIEPNKCYISMSNIDINKIKDIIMKTWKDLQKELEIKNFAPQIKFIVNNEEEENKANKIKDTSGLRIEVEKSSKYIAKEQQQNKLSNYFKAHTITKVDNGILKSYIERPGDSNNIGYMLEGITVEDMTRKLQEITKDPINRKNYQTLNEEELSKLVLDSLANEENRKKYLLESPREQIATNRVGTVTGTVAYHNEGQANKEIGVVVNSPSQTVTHNAVEENSNKVQVVEPKVQETHSRISAPNPPQDSNPSYSFTHQSNADYEETYQNVGEQRQKPNKIGVYTKTKTLAPHKSSSGLVTLPIIIFILSGLLLIASAVIYFISR